MPKCCACQPRATGVTLDLRIRLVSLTGRASPGCVRASRCPGLHAVAAPVCARVPVCGLAGLALPFPPGSPV